MPTTTNYGWTTPADTDLVKDGASAIRTLGTAIDTTVFNNAGAAIAKTIVDAKGDIIAATAADTVSRLAVGANDTVLTADSSTATGLKWAAPASGGMTLISTTTLTGASVTLSSIPSTYKNLQLIIRKYRPATDSTELFIRINGDATANRHAVAAAYGTGSNATFNSNWSQIAPVSDDGASDSLVIVNLYDYNDTTTWKIFDSMSVVNNQNTPTDMNRSRYHGQYNQTGAITSLELLPASGNFTSGTALLYGVK